MTPTLPEFRALSSSLPQSVSWLWPGHIAAGRLTLIDGDPGVGKSLLTLDLAARLTSASELPDGFKPGQPISVLILSAEDSLEDTIVPRLLGAGANLDRVHAPSAASGFPVFPEACPFLKELIQKLQARLVILDPFFAFLGSDIGSLNDLMIRRALAPLVALAEATQAAIVLVRHLRKFAAGEATYRGLGSIAILGSARTAFLVAPDRDDSEKRILACTKNNLGRFPPSLSFRIGSSDAGLPRLDWLGPVSQTAADLLESPRPRGNAVPQALAFLQSRLAQGPQGRQTLLAEAEQAGISFRSLERAKSQLGVVSEQRREDGRNVWYWSL
jgi:putative DNA primase/helicase